MAGEGAELERRRYSSLGLADALSSRPYDYPTACEELSLILRFAYSKLSKSLQSIIFQDTLSAFRRLPEVQTNHGISSANVLVQAVEVSLPKQKRSVAVSEFKHAMIAAKRRGKACQDEGSVQLPQDVLVHIFSFLDVRSLIVVSSVCWAWKSASHDNTLWQLQYSLLFGDFDSKTEGRTQRVPQDKGGINLQKTVEGENVSSFDWREAFKRKFRGTLSWRLTSHRAKCVHCKSILWMSHITCAGSHRCPKLKDQKLTIKPLAPYKIVEYLLEETNLSSSSSDSESDSDRRPQHMYKLWAYPRLIGTKD